MTIEVASELVEAELVPTEIEARASIDRAKGMLNGFWQEVRWQVENRAWESLGYDSLNEMWNAEYASMNVGISRAERPELVSAMRSAGQTQREIANKLGVGTMTVNRDLNPVPNGTDQSGEDRPRATPIPRQFDGAVVDLQRVTSRFRRIREDGNFNAKNRESIREVHLSDIDRAIEQLEQLRSELKGEQE